MLGLIGPSAQPSAHRSRDRAEDSNSIRIPEFFWETQLGGENFEVDWARGFAWRSRDGETEPGPNANGDCDDADRAGGEGRTCDMTWAIVN